MTKPSIVTIDFSHPFWDGVATLTLLPVILALRGWVLTLLFWWYVAPAFALPPLRIVQAVGWSLIVSLLVSRLDVNHEFSRFSCAPNPTNKKERHTIITCEKGLAFLLFPRAPY